MLIHPDLEIKPQSGSLLVCVTGLHVRIYASRPYSSLKGELLTELCIKHTEMHTFSDVFLSKIQYKQNERGTGKVAGLSEM